MDESNERRAVPPRIPPSDESIQMGQLDAGVAAKQAFENGKYDNNSPIIDEMGVVVQITRTCGNTLCNSRTRTHLMDQCIRLLVNDMNQRTTSLHSLLNKVYGSVTPPFEAMCDVCKTTTENQSFDRLGRMPDTLWIALDRANPLDADVRLDPLAADSTSATRTSTGVKPTTVVTFPERIDLSAYFVGTGVSNVDQREFQPPFMYDIVSVIMHSGRTINSGHYVNYSRVRNPESGVETWRKFDDQRTSAAAFQDTQVYTSQETATYLCLQRAPA
jgi:ubiquitin C-terminal hydrolase